MAEQLTANGQSLTTPWCQLEEMSGLLVAPARRGENVTVPGRHGVIRTPYKRWAAPQPVLPIRVLGVDRTTGVAPADALSQLHQNLDVLLALFSSETVLLEHTRDDDTVREAVAELAQEPVAVVRERTHPPMARLSVPLIIPDAFWSDPVTGSVTIEGPTGTTQTLGAFTGATAPMSALTILFEGPANNPRITVGDRFVQYNGVIAAGQQLVMDTDDFTVSAGGGGGPWTPDPRQVLFQPGPGWLEIPPTATSATFTHTGGGSARCVITGRRQYLTP